MFSKNAVQVVVENLWEDGTLGYSANKNNRFKILKVHKRRLSNVYHVKTTNPAHESKNVYIKVAKFDTDQRDLAGKKLEKEYAHHLDFYSKISHSSKFGIVRPLCVYPEVPAIVTESFPESQPIKNSIFKYLLLGGKKRRANTESLLFATGEMLRAFHDPHLQDIENLSQHQAELGDYIILRLKIIDEFLINNNYPHQASLVSIFEKYLKNQLFEQCSVRNIQGLTHGDFTPGNVLTNGKKLALIDFSESSTAPVYLDVGCFINFLVMLPLNKPILSKKRLTNLKAAFINGYGKHGKVETELCKLYQLRYLTTNLLTQLREMENSSIRGIFMKKRIARYLKEMENTLNE